MKFISIDDITEDMIFRSQEPYTKITVSAKKDHKIVRDSEKNHVGIAYSKKENKQEWDNYSVPMVYFFWKEYDVTQAMSSRGF